jgi:hypothetical protein
MMNLSKNLYVFMLALLIVASGCLGSGTTEGEEEVGSTVNNYYWNNTTEVITELPEMIALGGLVVGEDSGTVLHNYTATINTTAGQMMKINEARVGCGDTCYIKLETTCTDNVSFSLYVADGGAGGQWMSDSAVEEYAPGSAFDCTHTIDILDAYSLAQDVSWSFVYSIHPVTVG